MSRQELTLTIPLAIAILFALTGLPQASRLHAADVKPDSELNLTGTDVDRYLAAARTFIDQHREDPKASRAVLRALMVASVYRKTAAVADLKAMLALDYAHTIEGRFALTQFADAEKCRKFLNELIEHRIETLTPGVARQYMKAVAAAKVHWGPKIMTDDSFLLRTAVAASVAGSEKARLHCLAKLNQKKPDVIAVAWLAFDEKLGDVERIVKIQALSETVPVAADLVRYFSARLPETARQQPEVLAVVAENLLRADRFDQARGLLKKLAKAKPATGQYVVWEAWAQAVSGDKLAAGGAVSSLRAFVRKQPDSPWAATAELLARAIAGQSGRMTSLVDEISGITTDWSKDTPGLVKLRLDMKLENGTKIGGFASFDSGTKHFQAMAEKNGALVIAVSSSDSGSQLFFSEEPVIYRLDGKALFPQPQVSLNRADDGKFSLKLGMGIGSDTAVLQSMTKLLASSPWLSTRDGLQQLVEHSLISQGWFPLETTMREGELVVRIVKPRVTKPGVIESEVRIDRNRQRISAQTEKFQAALAWGDEKTTAWLPGPAWPEVAVKSTSDASMLFRVMGAASTLLSEPETRAAGKPRTTR